MFLLSPKCRNGRSQKGFKIIKYPKLGKNEIGISYLDLRDKIPIFPKESKAKFQLQKSWGKKRRDLSSGMDTSNPTLNHEGLNYCIT